MAKIKVASGSALLHGLLRVASWECTDGSHGYCYISAEFPVSCHTKKHAVGCLQPPLNCLLAASLKRVVWWFLQLIISQEASLKRSQYVCLDSIVDSKLQKNTC